MKNILFVALLSLITLTASADTKPTKTIANLKAAIISETTASAQYTAFALEARNTGNLTIAKLFDAASKSSSIHAANHSKVLASLGETIDAFTPTFEVKTTAENLQAAIDTETNQTTTVYPQFLANANEEEVVKAIRTFNFASDTQQKLQELLIKAQTALKANTQATLAANYLICPTCGNIYEKGTEDDKCEFCMTGKAKFIAI